jgi:tyrosyl-tRNA synthetase
MNIDTSVEKIEDILTRSIAEILPSKKEFLDVLKSGRRLTIYIGTDATGTSLHLGHATNYMILEKLRRLGHEVIFLIGDFTSRIGDPTDKNESARKQLTREDVITNTQTWLKQINPVIDIYNHDNPVVIKYNHDWLAKLTFEDIINLSSNFTVQQMLERDMFEKRLASGKPLYLHELFYPLMQGYDSVAMNVDVEMCGTDQKFNALAGRTLLRKLADKEKFVMITRLLENPITGEKMMSKSLGTGVFLDFTPNDMYGALMAQADENMQQLFEDCTWLSLDSITTIINSNEPRDTKMRLAKEITAIYHGAESAQTAEDNFVKTFQNKEIPDDIPEYKVEPSSNLIDILTMTEICTSRSDARRAIEQGAVKLDGQKVEVDEAEKAIGVIENKKILQKGKRHFVALI